MDITAETAQYCWRYCLLQVALATTIDFPGIRGMRTWTKDLIPGTQ